MVLVSQGSYKYDVQSEWGKIGGGVRQIWDTIERRRLEGSKCSGRPIFISFIKENRICTMTRHHAESNANILLTRYLPIVCGFRLWSHPLMINPRLKLDIQGQGGGEILDVDGQRVGVLKIRQFSWTSCMYLYVCMYLYDWKWYQLTVSKWQVNKRLLY